MKAGLMRLNYDPRYTHHPAGPNPSHKPYEPLSNRITLAKEIYKRIGGEKKPLKESLDEAARRRVRQHELSKGALEPIVAGTTPQSIPLERIDRSKRKSADSNQSYNHGSLSSHMSMSREELFHKYLQADDTRPAPEVADKTAADKHKLLPLKANAPPERVGNVAGQAKWRYLDGTGAVSSTVGAESGTPTDRVKKAYQHNSNFQIFRSPPGKGPPRTATSTATAANDTSKMYGDPVKPFVRSLSDVSRLQVHRDRTEEVILPDNCDVESRYASRENTPASTQAKAAGLNERNCQPLEYLTESAVSFEAEYKLENEPESKVKRVEFAVESAANFEEGIVGKQLLRSKSDAMIKTSKGYELYNNPYGGGKNSKEVRLAKQWQKPKNNDSVNRLAYTGSRALRGTQSTEQLCDAGAPRAGNPYQVYYEYMEGVQGVMALPRRPKSVSEYAAMQRAMQGSAGATRSAVMSTQEQLEFAKSLPPGARKQSLCRVAYGNDLGQSIQPPKYRSHSGLRKGGHGDMFGYYRSKTVPPPDYSHYNTGFRAIKNAATLEMERKAKVEAERAMKNKKIFTIIGPYPSLRQSLRKRGWVEKFLNAPPPGEYVQKKKPPSSNPEDPDYDGTAELKVKPWEEENGYYGMMSYVLRNCTPSFVFTVRSMDVDSRIVKNGQIVNHFGKAKNITTKIGLCQNLRNVLWYEKVDPDTFFPRCYKMDEEDERESFIEDFRQSACISFVQHFVEKYAKKYSDENDEGSNNTQQSVNATDSDSESALTTPRKPASANVKVTRDATAAKGVLRLQTKERTVGEMYKDVTQGNRKQKGPVSNQNGDVKMSVQTLPPQPQRRLAKGGLVSGRSLEIAYEQSVKYIRSRAHEDIDVSASQDSLTEGQWDQFITWYYQFVHDGGEIKDASRRLYQQCKECIEKISEIHEQHVINGVRNAWILKPGAKSRGRGIQVADKLGVCLQQAESDGGAMVIQKYIERPVLVYNTKFDIRQWFLVTDWNPLTVWFYKDCYLRFCTQEYTLDDFSVVIHLSNNSVQKHYKNQETRSPKLPEDNMWTSEEFAEYLRNEGNGEVWAEKVVPGMKKAILCSLLCTQEYIECRKSAFELYGADFMITPNFQPWLLEINSSPSMARNTRATCVLVDAVLEDTLKVVLDKKQDKSADTGRFELLYQQKYVQDPPPIDLSLSVSGRRIKKTLKGKKER